MKHGSQHAYVFMARVFLFTLKSIFKGTLWDESFAILSILKI